MISLTELKSLLSEEIEPHPGRAGTGYLDYKEVGGHNVHVHYIHRRRKPGHYRVFATVNGKLMKTVEKSVDTKTRTKMGQFVKSSVGNFLKHKGINPKSVSFRGNTKNLVDLYAKYATRSKAIGHKSSVSPFTGTVTVQAKPTDAKHVPSPYTRRRDDYQMHRTYGSTPSDSTTRSTHRDDRFMDDKMFKKKKKSIHKALKPTS